MNFKCGPKITPYILVGIICAGALVVCCDTHIVQRASSDYFRYDEGNWWLLLSADDTLIVEVEAVDTILETESIPVSYNGYLYNFALDDDAVRQYVNVVYYFSGEEYSIIEDYIVRIELPLVSGNSWSDSRVDSLYLFDQWIKASYYINGQVSAWTFDEHYGDVCTIDLAMISSYSTPDTTVVDSTVITEEYAPNLGVIRIIRTDGDYVLTDHEIH